MPSLLEQVINAPDAISDPAFQALNSSTSTDELKDKLHIIEKANQGQNIELSASIRRIQTMIQNDASLIDIKNAF
jgi:hypothetical protein